MREHEIQRSGDPVNNPNKDFCRYMVGRGTVTTTRGVLNDLTHAVALVEMTNVQSLTISSANANDTAAGTGARKVLVRGFDADWNTVEEIATLNGQTAVALTKVKIHPYVAIVTEAGSGLTNAGIIYVGYGAVTTGAPASKVLAIGVTGLNQSRHGMMAVPAGYECVITDLYAQTDGATASKLFFEYKLFGGLWLGGDPMDLPAVAGEFRNKIITPSFPEKTLIRATGSAASGNPLLTAKANMLFYKNGTVYS